MVSVGFQSKSFNITVIQVYTPTTNAEEAEVEQFYEDLQDLLELTHTHTHTHTHVLFIRVRSIVLQALCLDLFP